jgi:hypothetical protein
VERAVGSKRSLPQELVVLSVCADPEPQDALVGINAEDPVVNPDSARPESSDSFEVKRRMARIALEK